MMHKTVMGRGESYADRMKRYSEPVQAPETKEATPVAQPSKQELLEALESLDDCARMGMGVDCHGPYNLLKKFISDNA